MSPRFILGILFLAILLLMAKVLMDAPMGRARVADLFSDHTDGVLDHSVQRAIAIDEAAWSRAEALTIQSISLGLLGLIGVEVGFCFSGSKRTAAPDTARDSISTNTSDQQKSK